MPFGLQWDAVLESLTVDSGDISRANAELLRSVRERWEGTVVAGNSLHVLTFSFPNHPSAGLLLCVTHDGRFAESGGRFTFSLAHDRGAHRVETCWAADAPEHLDVMLARLTASPDSPTK